LTETARSGVRDRFAELMKRKSFSMDDVDAGREYVKAYVGFAHYVEGLYQAASGSPHGHSLEAEDHAGHAVEPAQEHAPHAGIEGDQQMKPRIPKPLKAEHDQLHEELVKATQADGKIGEAATAVARVLHPHFVKEEEYALPPLGLLQAVSRGEVLPEMRDAISMTDKLKAELPQMLSEHKAIVAALEALKAAAVAEHDHDVAHFAEKLIVHARTEEEVMYPAAILVGEYLKLKLPR
jgi:hemerythrin superfamily protein